MAGFYDTPTKSEDKGGFFSFKFDFLGNLASDVKDAAYGFFPGLGQLAIHPIRTAKAIGRSYAEDSVWSSLIHGNFGEAGTRFYEHPLSPLLDVAALFSGGGAVAGTTGGFTLGVSCFDCSAALLEA